MTHASRIAEALERADERDLFGHAELETARAAVEMANKARDYAEDKLRKAYPGVLRVRTRDFIAATSELLRAEGHLKRLESSQ